MSEGARPAKTWRNLPLGDEIFLDHVGHFVREAEAASEALRRAGFTPTPVSIQSDRDPSTGGLIPTGTGNVTAMLRRGYLEMLFKTADTPLGRELYALSMCPDFVVNRGHYFGTDMFAEEPGLSDSEKRDLIEFLKTL